METEKIANTTVLRKTSSTEGIMLPDFRLHDKAAVIRRMILTQNRHIDLWNKIESPEINPRTFSQLTYWHWKQEYAM